MILYFLTAAPALAGGADVSTDEIYADDVVMTTEDGAPLDIDGDGNTDLAIAANRISSDGRSRYYLGNGDGTFSPPVLLQEGRSSSIAAADLNGDMIVDLVHGRRDLTNLLYLGDGAGGIGGDSELALDTDRSLSIAIGDLDLDGDLDIVIGNGREGGEATNPPQVNRFYLNNNIPDGTFNFSGADVSADAEVSRSIVLADLDGDGDLDIVAASDATTPSSNRIYLNQYIESGSVFFATGIEFGPADDSTAKILVGDLNNDGLPDIVTLNFVVPGVSSGVNRFFLNESQPGLLQLGPASDVTADVDITNGGVLADFDGDGDLDLAVANFMATADGQSSRNRLYLNQFVETGVVSFAPGQDISSDEQMSHELAAADLNGDGHLDIVVGNRNQVTGVSARDRRYLNNGTADPFTNVAPVIDSQTRDLETAEDADIEIVLEDVSVTDPDNVYPNDFTLTVQSGDNYTVQDNLITPAAGFAGDLTVPAVVSDGTDDSEAFNLIVTVIADPQPAPPPPPPPPAGGGGGGAHDWLWLLTLCMFSLTRRLRNQMARRLR